ncbi:acetoacetate--CoA ligase [Gordonia sp. HY002]|uniref:acetoacetate--CoA ligase n=1 Tax=Gordonia zhenghanii TaxID=2911516 RepID=UPI001EEFB49E|nr:acetoacetate--CoA ligase [Gordonia zhenghanii]MCF8570253.1 acetoacetate--CoA ligase [Gordonia zhenghanii]MCF8606834.1 acetoacetate--CoA ligase [Gordonia zhenghanii]
MSRSRMDVFASELSARVGRDLTDYADLWEYSVTDLPGFWRGVWDFFEVGSVTGRPLDESDQVLPDASMPGAKWFPDVHLNYVDAVLAHADRDTVAIVGLTEDGVRTEITWDSLPRLVGAVARTLVDAGVGEGDVVAAYLPDVPEAVIAFLATASLGAVWSGCGQDYAPEGAAGRLAQLRPKVLFSSAGYRFNGKDVDKRADSAELARLLGVGTHIVVGETSDAPDGTMTWTEAVAPPVGAPDHPAPVRVPFDHPLWVLFSSGTTGKPKGIVHGHGGVLLEHLKETGLHADLGPDSVFFWHTALSWMMWNFQIAGLLVGSRIVCYSGSPLYPDADRLWQIVADENVTYFGTSPGQLQASRKAGIVPGRDHDLSALSTLGSTGSTLAADLFTWVDDNVAAGLPVSSISGGTDIVSAFAGGSAGVPVVAGELSVRHLGVALESWSPQAEPLIGEVGEMVITKPMPSMPVSFWDDPDGERYRKAYFAHEWDRAGAPTVWRHGDWVTLTDRGSLVIHGRSDATLNRNGIRMGSADIYEVVEAVDEVAEGFVLGVDGPDGKYWMPLFVTLVDGAELTDELTARIASQVKTRLSARHVPDEVIVAPGIPHTRTGKKLEVPVTAILAGRSDVNIDPKSVDDYGLVDWYAGQGRAHEW